MQFFKHSTNMSADVKMKRVIRKYGLEGYGLYNAIIEKIAGALTSDRPIPALEDTAQDIAAEFNNDTVNINEIMAYMLNQGLFEIDEITGNILCSKIYKFIDKSQTRSPEIRKMIENYKQHNIECRIVSDKSRLSQTNLIDKEVDIDKEVEGGRFTPPTIDEVSIYLSELKETRINPQSFCDYYESKGWMIGKNKMRSWRAAVRTWINKQNENMPKSRYREL